MRMTTGVPTAAAMCIGPVSFETKTERRAAAAASCGTVSLSRTIVEGGNFGTRLADELTLLGSREENASATESLRSSIHASSAKRSTGQRRLGWPAPGKMPTSGESPVPPPPVCRLPQRLAALRRLSQHLLDGAAVLLAHGRRGTRDTSPTPSGAMTSR